MKAVLEKPKELELGTIATTQENDNLQTDHKVAMGYGKCRHYKCSCPGFYAVSGYTCTRGGCGHHYDEHW